MGSFMKVDAIKVAKECKKHGTYVELNARRLCFTDEEAKQMSNMGVEFVLSSDAHVCKNVGECNRGLNFAIKNNIPKNLIANLDKLPKFSYKK